MYPWKRRVLVLIPHFSPRLGALYTLGRSPFYRSSCSQLFARYLIEFIDPYKPASAIYVSTSDHVHVGVLERAESSSRRASLHAPHDTLLDSLFPSSPSGLRHPRYPLANDLSRFIHRAGGPTLLLSKSFSYRLVHKCTCSRHEARSDAN